MLRLVDDLLILSRLEGESQMLREEEFDVRDLIYEVSGEARRLSAGRHTITCEVVPATLKGSRDELHSAFSNLVSNAVRHSVEHGKVVIEIAANGTTASLEVVNEGQAIAPEHLDRVFDRFFRADPGRSRRRQRPRLGHRALDCACPPRQHCPAQRGRSHPVRSPASDDA
mgnify:CR=1 FL=1